MSRDAFDKTIPVNPPKVNKIINPDTHNIGILHLIFLPCIVANHLKILIPVGMAITIVTAVKYARVSTSIPMVYI
jgi:hypothetical protein